MLFLQHKAPLYAASAVTLILGDVLISLAQDGHALTIQPSAILGALLAGSLVGGIERRTDSAQLAALKGCVAGLVVALPYAVLGVAAGSLALAWALRDQSLGNSRR